MDGWHGTFQRALESLSENSKTATLYVHGSLKVMLYSPDGEDKQIPHDRDEVYFIASGAGEFQLGDSRFAFGPGDVIFVPAGAEHRFAEFGDDLASWVMFYGPTGGEAEKE